MERAKGSTLITKLSKKELIELINEKNDISFGIHDPERTSIGVYKNLIILTERIEYEEE